MANSDSDDEMPLALLKYKLCTDSETKDQLPVSHPEEIDKPTVTLVETVDGEPIRSVCPDDTLMQSDTSRDEFSVHDYDSDRDPEFNPGECEVGRCRKDVWAACPDCEILLCFDHFNEEITSCVQHGKSTRKYKKKTELAAVKVATIEDRFASTGSDVETPLHLETTSMEDVNQGGSLRSIPEEYSVEGSEKEVREERKRRKNKQKEAKRKRNLGQEYISIKTKKTVPAKQMKARCKGDTCMKQKKQCTTVTDQQRQAIFDSYHSLGDLRLQREYLVRHVKCCETKRKYTESESSRRSITKQYMLPVGESLIPVCKVFFYNTLGISEQSSRTALSKLTSTGTMEEDKRGGRQSEAERQRDASLRKRISDHIDRFPKVESHYCREKTSKEYLCPDLTKRAMYQMFLKEWIPKPRPPSFSLYKEVFRSKNLSIHRPKKDQCSLCANYYQGNEETKNDLKDKFEAHVGEKKLVREIKEACKKEAAETENVLCASFDLQQVIYLPISQESDIFYKRRLSNYNLTFYNIANKDCHCFTWDETQSKRGSSEISTAVYRALKFYDDQGIKKAYLFADGCSGQNKNSITPAMMLYTVANSMNLEEISLRFFVTNHGQNEGDSAHSAIGHALKKCGDLFLPSQVATVMSMARSQNPYLVNQMQSEDFLDFKGLSKDLRILDARRGSDTEENFYWNGIMELRVFKNRGDQVFYKTSHFQTDFKTMYLKRLKKSVKEHKVLKLNSNRVPISKEKYSDLASLCSGPTPVVKLAEHKSFYLSLPHD